MLTLLLNVFTAKQRDGSFNRRVYSENDISVFETTLAVSINCLNGTVHFKNVNNSLNTNIYSYKETSGGPSSNLYLNVVNFFQYQC
jgi:hypothetical protein